MPKVLSTGGCLPQCMLGYPPGQTTPRQTPLGQTPPPWADTPPPTATAADGTHPTRMLSCFVISIQTIVFNLIKTNQCAPNTYSLKLHVNKFGCTLGLIPVFVYFARWNANIPRISSGVINAKIYQSKNRFFQTFDFISYYLHLTCSFFVSTT